VYSAIETNRKEGQKPVRVAILDTGLDENHPAIQEALTSQKIMCRGFPASLNPFKDTIGHGTFGASVLMRTAPSAFLYIARIFSDDRNIDKPEVAKVAPLQM
jgi:subtilisin family serine protease